MAQQQPFKNMLTFGKIFLLCFMTPFVASGIFIFLIGIRVLDFVGEDSWIILIFSIIWNLLVFSSIYGIIKGFKKQQEMSNSLMTPNSEYQQSTGASNNNTYNSAGYENANNFPKKYSMTYDSQIRTEPNYEKKRIQF